MVITWNYCAIETTSDNNLCLSDGTKQLILEINLKRKVIARALFNLANCWRPRTVKGLSKKKWKIPFLFTLDTLILS